MKKNKKIITNKRRSFIKKAGLAGASTAAVARGILTPRATQPDRGRCSLVACGTLCCATSTLLTMSPGAQFAHVRFTASDVTDQVISLCSGLYMSFI